MRYFILSCLGTAPFLLLAAASGCGDDCVDKGTCCHDGTTNCFAQGGQGAGAGNTGGSTTTNGGDGGSDPCSGCDAALCVNDTCVDCVSDAHCTDPDKAKCDVGTNTCVDCDDSEQCAGIAGAGVCSGGDCVECVLGEEEACTGETTCNLVTNECVAVAPGDVGTCEPCTNDLQCSANHRCIPMEFPVGTSHGYFCLEEAMPTCEQPYLVFINEQSISGADAVNYCGFDQNITTCQAVRALEQGWRCEGDDGKCCSGSVALVDGMCDSNAPEVDVPGALCRQVGAGANRCTYACATALDCPSAGPPSSCGGMPTPTWCGG
jgi:hypothetical protein